MSRPYTSGFCAIGNPADSHARCVERVAACACPCHLVTAAAGPTDPVTGVTSAVDGLVDQLGRLIAACTAPDATDLAEFLTVVRESRQRLYVDVEQVLETETAKAMMSDYAETSALRVERSRATDRKAWDHESWQHDARAKVLRAHGMQGAQGVLSAQGEVIDPRRLHDVLADLQAVHGSAAPKTTALRNLGLDSRDYCESTPGAWRVKVTRMADETSEGDAA